MTGRCRSSTWTTGSSTGRNSGRLIRAYAGWGMRTVFVPDDELDRTPKIAVREPGDHPFEKEG